jgi:transcriptional regulator with XRE-family HTH domain
MSELADFLRARREHVQPADVGLPDSGRRRTPGLRREEVATLAGVSIDYLVRLEQGRDTNPSPSVLAALADALLLTDEERLHLHKLAAKGHAPELCPKGVEPTVEVAPTVRALLDGLDPLPAFVVGFANDVLAWNDGWARLVEPLGLREVGNLARYAFLDRRARRTYPDWDEAADDQVRQLRSAWGLWHAEPALLALVDDLSAEPEFARRWSAHAVAAKQRGTKRLRHPAHGELRFDFEVLTLGSEHDQRLVSWLPADEATKAALAPTAPARLRVV